jgi:plasmid stability protein
MNMSMTQLEVNNVPESTLAALRTRARRHRRSLNREILSIFDWVVVHGTGDTAADSSDPDVLRQKREMEELVGSWDDSRTASEIIADIEAARTAGREVAL